MTMVAFGRKVEHDPRSKAFPVKLVEPRTVTWLAPGRKGYGPVMDQNGYGACVGFTIAEILNSRPVWGQRKKFLQGGGKLLDNADALNLYSISTQVDQWPDSTFPPDDEGTSGLAGCKAAKQLGYIREYRHAFGLVQMKSGVTLQPVGAGVMWKADMMEPDKRGYLHASGGDVGGHEFTVVGINLRLERFTILNHWYNEDGTPWGNDGRAFIRFTDMGVLLDEGGDVVIPIV